MSYDPHDDAIGEFAEQVLKDRSIEGGRYYLAIYGDAVEARVSHLLAQARDLTALKYPASALVLAATAIEITVRFMLVRPLVQGAFLSDEWAELLAARIGTGKPNEDRKIVRALLKQWSLDIDSISLRGGDRLWDTITIRVLPKRNKVVHAGESATLEDAGLGIECAERLLSEVVHPIGKALGLTVERTGRWCQIHRITDESSGGATQWWSSYSPRSPFDDA